MSGTAIPTGWDQKPVKSIAKITTGNKDTKDRVNNGIYPFFVRSQTVERINSVGFDGEGVLTAGDGVGTGKIFHYINGKCDFHQRVYLMHSFSEGVTGRYFFYYFSHFFYDRVMSMTAKSSVDSVRREMIADMEILFPNDLEEQQAIADALSDADGVVNALDRLISKKRLILRGAMQDLLTGTRRLPGFSDPWETKPFGEIVHRIYPKSKNPASAGKATGRYPFFIAGEKVKYTEIPDHHDLNAIVFSCGGVFRTHYTSGSFSTSYHCLVVETKGSAQFYEYWMRLNASPLDRDTFSGSGLRFLDKSRLLETDVPVPPVPEQNAIARILSDMDAEITTLEARRVKARALKAGMMDALLSGRIRLPLPEKQTSEVA